MIALDSARRGLVVLALLVAGLASSAAAQPRQAATVPPATAPAAVPAAPPAAAPAAPPMATPAAAPPSLAAAWAPLAFLIGQWEAEGGGATGASTGSFTFEPAADGHALLRRNESISSGVKHTDIMLLHTEPKGGFGATYADNEGHVIRYAITASSGPKGAIFLSDSAAGAARFRLTYRLNPDGTLAIAFDVARPGATEFKNYVEGEGHRK